MDKCKYKISVIIPIYNVEDYLRETIESVVKQTIGFKENIQLILVNDGSPDKSEDICLEYKKKYPENVIYIKKKNGGVSSARNEGIKHAEGFFTTMLDSDDKWTKDSFESFYKESIKHPEINVFSCKILFFNAGDGNHPLNYKYKKNKIVNILGDDYDYPQLSSCNVFIKTEVIKKYKYDCSVKYGEDNKLINEIIFDETKYMILKKPTYLYRKRDDGLSAIQGSALNDDWYFVTPMIDRYLFDLSMKKFGCIIKYIQNIVCYELNWRVIVNKQYDFKGRRKEYSEMVNSLIRDIDNDIILHNKKLNINKCVYLLSKKDKKIYDKINLNKNKAYIDNYLYPCDKLVLLVIDQVYQKNNSLFFYGRLDQKFINKKDFKILLNDKKVNIDYYDLTNNSYQITYDGEKLYNYVGISFSIKIDKKYLKTL